MDRELRYTVLKDKDIGEYLTDDEMYILDDLCHKIIRGRLADGRGPLLCVVVEHDWPEYEPTWEAIGRRVDTEQF